MTIGDNSQVRVLLMWTVRERVKSSQLGHPSLRARDMRGRVPSIERAAYHVDSVGLGSDTEHSSPGPASDTDARPGKGRYLLAWLR